MRSLQRERREGEDNREPVQRGRRLKAWAVAPMVSEAVLASPCLIRWIQSDYKKADRPGLICP